MSGPRHDAYRHYVTQLEALHAAAHHPSAARIAAEIRATTHGPVVSASTIKGWLAEKQTPRTIPRDGARFALVLAVLHRLAGRRFDRHIPRQWDTWRNNAAHTDRPAEPDRPADRPAPEDHRAEPAPPPSSEEPVFEVDRILRQEREWAVHAELREVEFRTRLLVRAKGNQDQRGWWFCGRHTALTDIADWLRTPDPARPLLAVTGDPGSGKTAVLGLIATLDHPVHRRTVPIHSIGLPADAIAPPGTIDVTIYAQGLTIDQVRDGIAAAARIPAADTPGALADGLATRATMLTVLIDGLDEAAVPHALVQELLRPLIVHASRHVRLLVGTRPYLLEELGTDRERSVDLDADRYADLEALTAYTVRGLRDADPDSIYPTQPPDTVRAVAAAVAEQAHRCFLVARIVAATLAATPTLPDPTDPAWRASLPTLPGDAMRDDLDTRLREKADTARDLLLPLAFAQGQGLPWEDLWAALASALAGVDYTDHDLIWLHRTAGSYVVEATENGRSAYRLYHQALAEHLTQHTDPHTVHTAFYRVLRGLVPIDGDGRRDWARAHPYTLTHLATHATHAGLIDNLVTDMDYLTHARPGPLLGALPTAATQTTLLIRAIYRSSADIHRNLPPLRRRQILAVDAARFTAAEQQRELNRGLEWQVRWADGSHVHHAQRAVLTGHNNLVLAAACTSINGRPVAVTGGGDDTVRVWDLDTGTERAVLTGHTGTVEAAACTTINGRPVAVTGSL
uniref:WD40 repeat domain-containing protein n=1 Tax=Nocardia takedensis TaxID=259390 RepID=UPI001C3F323F